MSMKSVMIILAVVAFLVAGAWLLEQFTGIEILSWQAIRGFLDL